MYKTFMDKFKDKTVEELLLAHEDQGIIVNYLGYKRCWHCALNTNSLDHGDIIHAYASSPKEAILDALNQII